MLQYVRGGDTVPYIFAIVVIVIIANFFMFNARRKRSRGAYRKTKEERVASEKRLDNLKRKLDHEQLSLAKRVEKQNRMFELYEQVRSDAKASEETGGHAEPAGEAPSGENDAGAQSE